MKLSHRPMSLLFAEFVGLVGLTLAAPSVGTAAPVAPPVATEAKVDSKPKPSAENESVQPALDRALKVRDPFKQPTYVGKKASSELEAIPVENFVLLGVMTGPLKTKAMVAAPGGKTFFITEGTKIGTRKGIVRKIEASEIIIREHVINYLGTEEAIEAKIVAQVRSNEVIEGEVARLQSQTPVENFSVGAAWLKPDAFSGNPAAKPQAAPAPVAPQVPAASIPVLSK